ncbi:hypothetical protein OUZ56_008320 [Daphnia magna]|uniref:Secreted protein n=1 Tax=Daphnia magna TaxID=35525 RepID=A0ABR0ACL5_9CRUS|nr:hypothetical protein OUZ56_008320 [Daphnia magna]
MMRDFFFLSSLCLNLFSTNSFDALVESSKPVFFFPTVEHSLCLPKSATSHFFIHWHLQPAPATLFPTFFRFPISFLCVCIGFQAKAVESHDFSSYMSSLKFVKPS